MDEVLAGRRDASWYKKPSVSWVYHVGATAERRGCTVQRETAACDPDRVLLVNMIPASEVPERMRCRRAGCRSRWPTLTQQEP